MCINPVLIKNPNLGVKFPKGSVNSFKDCTSAYIRVPCGHCFECISSRKMKLVQRSQMMSKYCVTYFLTFTYDNKHLPYLEVPFKDNSDVFKLRYADIRDMQLCLKRFRNAFALPFKYLYVSERGAKNGRPHFHLLLFIERSFLPDYLSQINTESLIKSLFLSYWSVNVGSDKFPIYEPLLTYIEKFRNGHLNSTFDCHLVLPSVNNDGVSDVVYYVTKYLLKNIGHNDSLQQKLKLNLSDEEYKIVWSKVKDKCIYSKDFGIRNNREVRDYLRRSLDLSLSDDNCCYPSFIDCDSGKLVPMCDFYKDVSLTYDDAYTFNQRYRKKFPDTDFIDTPSYDERELSDFLQSISKGNRIVQLNETMSLFDESDFFFQND